MATVSVAGASRKVLHRADAVQRPPDNHGRGSRKLHSTYAYKIPNKVKKQMTIFRKSQFDNR